MTIASNVYAQSADDEDAPSTQQLSGPAAPFALGLCAIALIKVMRKAK